MREKMKLYGRNTLASLIIVVQILFFPAVSLADSAPVEAELSVAVTTPADNTESNTPSVANNPSDTTYSNSESDNTTATEQTTQMDTIIDSLAQSGDASVDTNALAGDATSGNAAATTTLLNLAQSAWSVGGGDLTTFIANIGGSIVGDMMLDPATVGGTAMAPGQTLPNQAAAVHTNAAINNDIWLTALSGNASVNGNAQAGNATTGTAYVLANIVNIINSSIAAGNSFIGTINILGNLEGDILLPAELLQQLATIESAATNSNYTQSDDGTSLVSENNDTIVNDISLDAVSGQAVVANNAQAGNATTGQATTNLSVFNAVNNHIIGDNSFLVIVNVLGEWLGMIVGTTPGTKTAMLGAGQNSAAPAPDIAIPGNMHATTSAQIVNTLHLSAASGDAAVTNNMLAGNATSGNAQAAANIFNLAGSQLSLSNWFGVLFINVLGTWHGSFGIDTPMGGISTAPNTATQQQPSPVSTAPNNNQQVTNNTVLAKTTTFVLAHFSNNTGSDNDAPANVLGAAIDSDTTLPPSIAITTKPTKPTADTSRSLALVIISTLTAGAALLAVERSLYWFTARRELGRQ